jgi:hypothetical protein
MFKKGELVVRKQERRGDCFFVNACRRAEKSVHDVFVVREIDDEYTTIYFEGTAAGFDSRYFAPERTTPLEEWA